MGVLCPRSDVSGRRHRTRRFGPILTLAVLIVAFAACEPVAPIRPSSNVKFRLVKTVSHTLSGNFNGAGPNWEQFSTPAVADITGDGRPEVIFTTVDGWVFAVRPTDGRTVWSRYLGRTAIQSAPAVGQIAGSSAADVVVGTLDNRVVVLDGPTGGILRTMGGDRTQFCPGHGNCRPAGFFSSPAIADVDGDGRNDIVASSYDHNVYAWTGEGRLIFRRFIEDTSWSSPVVRDIDGDLRPEVIVGGDIYAGNNLGVPEGGLVWVFTRAGGQWHNYPHYPKSIPGQTVWSTPAVQDLNGDGRSDIVVGTGNYYGQSAATRRVYAFTAATGDALPGWPITTWGQVSNGPVVGDVDRDGKNEVAFASEGDQVYVRNRNGTPRWNKCSRIGGCVGSSNIHSSVSMADLDGDGVQEVLATSDHELTAFDGRTGAVKGRYAGLSAGSGAPTVAVVGGKGYVVVAGTSNTGAPPKAGDKASIFILTTDQAPGAMAWPTFKRSPSRAG